MYPRYGSEIHDSGKPERTRATRREPDCDREERERHEKHLKRVKGPQAREAIRNRKLLKPKEKNCVEYNSHYSSSSSSISVGDLSKVVGWRTQGVSVPSVKVSQSNKLRTLKVNKQLTDNSQHTTREQQIKPATTSPTTLNPKNRKYRYGTKVVIPYSPKPLTKESLKGYTMDSRRKNSAKEMDFETRAVELLYGMIDQDPSQKVIKTQLQVVEKLREASSTQPTDPLVAHAEKTLFQMIKQGADAYEIQMQAGVVHRLNTRPSHSASTPTGNKNRKRTKTSEPDHKNQEKVPPKKRSDAIRPGDRPKKPVIRPAPAEPTRKPATRAKPTQLVDITSPPSRSNRVRPRQSTPPPPRESLSSSTSPSPVRKRPRLAHPRFGRRVKDPNDKDDKASRQLMHPASAPTKQLPKDMRRGDDIEGMKDVQTVHPTYKMASTNPAMKHVRVVNRTNGKRQETLPERDDYARIGIRRDEERSGPREIGGQSDDAARLTTDNLEQLGGNEDWEMDESVADIIEAEYGSVKGEGMY